MSDTTQYGNYYFCAKVSDSVSANGEIYLMADTVIATPDGGLIFSRKDSAFPNLILAKGTWSAVYAASLLDGSAIAVEHWAGEISEEEDNFEDARPAWLSDKNPLPKHGGNSSRGRMKFPERGRMRQGLRFEILERDGNRCKKCGHGAADGYKLHVDHIVPVSKGGKTETANLQTLCEACNSSKSDN